MPLIKILYHIQFQANIDSLDRIQFNSAFINQLGTVYRLMVEPYVPTASMWIHKRRKCVRVLPIIRRKTITIYIEHQQGDVS